METYDPQNVFAKILRGEMPAFKVYEDDVSLAFMDIMPRSDGHVLVIPKAPARNIFDIKAADLAALMPRVQHVARAARLAMGADGISVAAIQRECRRPSGVSSARPRSAALDGRVDAPTGHDGRQGSFAGQCRENYAAAIKAAGPLVL